MRLDSIPHLILYFVAFVALYYTLKTIYATWLATKETIKASLLRFFTRLLANQEPAHIQAVAILPTGFTADSMTKAHADLNKFSDFLKAK